MNQMPNKTKSRAQILPSIDGLIGMIAASKTGPDAEKIALREVCRQKLRSYKVSDYLKRYATPEEQAAARARWEAVNEFANPQ